jgi:hypothetical protein
MTIVSIPADHVGLVVGKGGATVRQIQELSRAHVHVPPPSYNSPTCDLQVVGAPDSVQSCIAMIQVSFDFEPGPLSFSLSFNLTNIFRFAIPICPLAMHCTGSSSHSRSSTHDADASYARAPNVNAGDVDAYSCDATRYFHDDACPVAQSVVCCAT